MNIIDTLKLLDTDLFLLINGHHSAFFDGFMFAVSEKLAWIPLYASVLYILIKHWKKEAIWLILSLILCIVISDQVSSGILKDLIKRLRPSHAEELKGMIHFVNGYTGGLYGFCSSHASNAFGFALLSSLIFNRKIFTYAIFAWAVITAYSRIYLGVHYPTDILGGVVVGTFSALICYWAIRRFKSSILVNKDSTLNKFDTLIPVIVLLISYLVIIIYSITSI